MWNVMFLRNKNYEMMLIIQRYDYIFDMYIRFQNKTATCYQSVYGLNSFVLNKANPCIKTL